MNAVSLRGNMNWSRIDRLMRTFLSLVLSKEPALASMHVTRDFVMFGVRDDGSLFREVSAAFLSIGVDGIEETRIAAGSLFDLVSHVDEATDIRRDETVVIARLRCRSGDRLSIAAILTNDPEPKIRRVFDPSLFARALERW